MMTDHDRISLDFAERLLADLERRLRQRTESGTLPDETCAVNGGSSNQRADAALRPAADDEPANAGADDTRT